MEGKVLSFIKNQSELDAFFFAIKFGLFLEGLEDFEQYLLSRTPPDLQARHPHFLRATKDGQIKIKNCPSLARALKERGTPRVRHNS